MGKKWIAYLAVLIGVGLLAACASQPTAAPAPPTETLVPTAVPVSFAKNIMPLLNSRCGSCHGKTRPAEGLSYLNYDTMMQGSKNGPVVIPGDPDNSLMIQLMIEQKMPKKGPKLTPAQLQLFIDWIAQGAANN
jgi:mono/diheme cytochrome c family protein